jgi:ABC-type phosphate transport system substrate-binding protein
MKRFNTWLMPSILMAALLAAPAGAAAGVVAIVNIANTAADRSTISKLYTGAIKTWPDGSQAKLYDLSDELTRDEFCRAYTGKNAGTIKNIWAKAVFTGRAVPPRMLDSDREVKDEVSKDKNAVGYVKESSVDGSVRAVR